MKQFLIHAFFLSVFFTFCDGIKAQSFYPQGMNAYSMQMHAHGLSHHNGSNQPGSMQYHNYFAQQLNVDVIWWTEHFDFWEQPFTIHESFNGAFIDSANQDIIVDTSLNSQSVISILAAATNGGTEVTSLIDSGFQMNYTSPLTTFNYFSYKPRGIGGALKGTRAWIRPLTSLPQFSFNLTAAGLSAQIKTQVQCTVFLSYHKYPVASVQAIVYNFVSGIPYSRMLINNKTVQVNIPVVNYVKQLFIMNIADDAALLPDGLDNTITDYEFKVRSKNGFNISAAFQNIALTSDDNNAQQNISQIRTIAGNYVNQYGVKNYVSSEITPSANETHITGYFPDENVDSGVLRDSANVNEDIQLFVDNVHANGGVTAFCHPFGVNHDAFPSDSAQKYRVDTMYPSILHTNAYNCDMIEAGYANRGGCDLKHHLMLWDKLTAHELFLYGIATNDTHGTTWFGYNTLTTYAWSPDSSAQSLINAMRAGRLYMADNTKWKGRFYFRTDFAEMGDRLPLDVSDQYLKVCMDSLPEGWKIKVSQVLIRPNAKELKYIMRDSIMAFSDSILLHMPAPNFVRVTVYDTNNKMVIISNPIVFFENNFFQKTENDQNAIQHTDEFNTKLEVFPNPANDVVKVICQSSDFKNSFIYVYDNSGKMIHEIKIEDTTTDTFQTVLNLSDYKSGYYSVAFYNNGKIKTGRFLHL